MLVIWQSTVKMQQQYISYNISSVTRLMDRPIGINLPMQWISPNRSQQQHQVCFTNMPYTQYNGELELKCNDCCWAMNNTNTLQ